MTFLNSAPSVPQTGRGPLVLDPRPPQLVARRPSLRKRALWGMLGTGISLGLALVAVKVHRSRVEAERNETVRDLPLRLVSRVDFQTRLTAAGRVESHTKTVISCELERLSVSNEGRSVSSNGNSRVIEVIPEGVRVQKGDVLCRLDASEYDELVRTQAMKTDQALAALEQAQLNFNVAELAVEEFREGLAHQNSQLLEGQIALAESDLERANDRLRWTTDMLGKGYVPLAQQTTAERTLAQTQHKLMMSRWTLKNFNDYGNPRTLKTLQSEVEKRRYEVTANTQRVNRFQERLAHYRKMVDSCTIRSPHEGLLIYAIDPKRRNVPRLEPGVEVFQQQQLFYLPDLTAMEVVTYLHESVARRVGVGLSAQVRIEGLNNQLLPGHVTGIGPLPVASPVWTTSEEVKYFVATIQLDEVPTGLLPGMSAEAEINLDRSREVLAVPSEAVASEQGHDICYVAGIDGLERRQITLGRSNRDLLEVTRGLVEGEEVVINPEKVVALDSLVVHSAEGYRDQTATDSDVIGTGPVGVD